MTPQAGDRSDGIRTLEMDNQETRNPNWIVILVLVGLPIIFNAIALLPEVQYATPNSNDQIFHYVFIERANQAISAGDNPFDHWLPELELGFPQFLYYQNLPHLTVVTLYRLLLKKVSLLRLLNLVRYLLLVMFPMTVYWSMRRMEFSAIAAAVGAAISPMLSSAISYGFDYNSYVWRGFGMFPQLCCMHLMFVSTACVRRVLERGRGYCAAIIASAAMVLSDLLYGYIFAVVVAVLWLLSLGKAPGDASGLIGLLRRAYRSSVRLAIVVVPAALITAYQTIPFFALIRYLNQAQLQTWRPHSIGAAATLTTIFTGHYFDNDRLPVVSMLVLVGVLFSVIKRPKGAELAVTILAVSTVLFFGGSLAHRLPISHIVPFVRFSAGIDFGAILAAGLGGEFLWDWCSSSFARMQAFVAIALLLVLYTPAAAERWNFFRGNKAMMELSDQALESDSDLPEILSALKKAPPGRVYAGTRANWGTWMSDGYVHLYDLLPINQFATVMPFQTLSLNSPYLWQLATPGRQICRLFNIRYIVAPPSVTVPDFYRPLRTTTRYILYELDSGGYLQLGQVTRVVPMGSSQDLFLYNRNWLKSQEPEDSEFTVFTQPNEPSDPGLAALTDSRNSAEDSGRLGLIEGEVVTPDSFGARVTANSRALLIFKVSYHPNWHVFVNGREQRAFMVSPSFIGTEIPAGHHEVRAEYRSSNSKKALLALGCLTLLATIAIWTFGLEQRLFNRTVIGENDANRRSGQAASARHYPS